MAIQPIDYYFQNAFNDRIDFLNQLDYGDLADLQMIILKASAEAKVEGCDELDMREAAEMLEADAFFIHSGIEESIRVLSGFPSVDALNLVRAIVDIMEIAKVD